MQTKEFSVVREESDARNEERDCTVKALALVCDVSYAKAHKVLAGLGRKPNCGVPLSILLRAVEKLGYFALPQRVEHNGKTVKQLRGNAPLRGVHLVEYARHVAAYKHGIVHDYDTGMANFRVVRTYKIFRKQ